MRQIQNNAYLLVNPRLISDPISEVTFPSKIFEYMSSSSPVLSTRLSGFTNDYNEKLFFSKSDSVNDLSYEINQIMSLPLSELNKIVKNANNFIKTKKTWSSQISLIYFFLKKS